MSHLPGHATGGSSPGSGANAALQKNNRPEGRLTCSIRRWASGPLPLRLPSQKLLFKQGIDRVLTGFDETAGGLGLALQPAGQVFQSMTHLLGSTIDCHTHCFGPVRHGNRLMPLGPCFDLAALVVTTGLVRVLIADMDHHPGQQLVEVFEPVHHFGTDPLLKSSTTFNLIGANLNLHGASSFSWGSVRSVATGSRRVTHLLWCACNTR